MRTASKPALLLLATSMAIASSAVRSPAEVDKVNLVEMGRDLAESLNCILCHSTKEGSDEGKVGPTWFGLIQKVPRLRRIATTASGATPGNASQEKSVTADEAYVRSSIISPANEIAIRESGPSKDAAYPPAMPPYPNLSDQQLRALIAYLKMLNHPEMAGPAQIMAKKEPSPAVERNVFEITVKDRARIQRVAIENVSTRAISVGLPGGYNYIFDPSTLSVKKIWAGGFLNVASERSDRGIGYNRISDTGHLLGFDECLLPLGHSGPVDQGFKDYINNENDRTRRFIREMQEPRVFSGIQARDQAKFGGYMLSKTNAPTFLFSINGVQYKQRLEFEGSHRLHFHFETKGASQPVRFRIKEDLLGSFTSNAGSFSDGVLTIPPGQAGKFSIILHLKE